MALAADLSDEAAVEALLPQATAALGPIGVLVNNASIFENDTVATATRESWDAHLAVNLRAPFVLTQEFAAAARRAGGVVVNLLDERVWNLTPYFVSYTVSKSGAVDADPDDGAGAGAAHPGQRRSGPGPTLPSPRQSREQFERQCRTMPLQRGTSPRRDRRGAALHPGGAGDDRADDRARWRPASWLGAAGHSVTVE